MRDIIYELYGKKYDQVVIHIGYPKTGSSFLQLEIFPKIRNKNLCILSDESLIGRVFKKDISDMEPIALMLKRLYPDAKIMIGIRDHKSILKSLYSQYVKEGGNLGYEEFLDEKINMERLNYKKWIDLYKKLFGEKKVWVYNFEDFKKDIDKVLQDMCKFIGCEVPKYDKNKRYATRWTDRQIKLCRMAHKYPWLYKPRFWVNQLGK